MPPGMTGQWGGAVLNQSGKLAAGTSMLFGVVKLLVNNAHNRKY